MAKITFEKDGIEFTDEGSVKDMMDILIDYMRENDLKVESSASEELITQDGAMIRYSDNFVTFKGREPFGKFSVEA